MARVSQVLETRNACTILVGNHKGKRSQTTKAQMEEYY
jgi:hypothetical protein